MAIEFNVDNAKDWSEDYTQKVLAYCEQRARYADMQRIAELRGGEGTDPSAIRAGTDEWFADATASEIADWVGDDKEKAALALQKENEREEPRSRLSSKLEKIASE